MPDTPPGFALFRALSPTVAAIGDVLLVLTTIAAVIAFLATAVFVLRSEWAWFRSGERQRSEEDSAGSRP
jgi:hypothetical protein